jgi:hypothetical protein
MQSHSPSTFALIVILWFGLIAAILYLLTLERALKQCIPASRTMKPGKVWLLLIPIFGLVWQFVVVMNVAKSLGNEFARLGVPSAESRPGQNTGLAACICNCCIFIPILGHLAGIAGLVLLLVYWGKIASYSRDVQARQAIVLASPIA